MKHERATHLNRTWFAALLCMACVLPVRAQQSSLQERVQLNGQTINTATSTTLRIDQSQGEPLATTAPQNMWIDNESGTARQTMLWAVRPSGWGVGIGVEQRGPYRRDASQSGQPMREGGLLMGVSLNTSENTQLTLQTPMLKPQANTARALMEDWQQQQQSQQQPASQRQLRMGLVFNTTKPYADLRRGFRMELSGQTTVTFKPRGGRVGVTLQKIW